VARKQKIAAHGDGSIINIKRIFSGAQCKMIW
jgi:GTPase SAR1 family protein